MRYRLVSTRIKPSVNKLGKQLKVFYRLGSEQVINEFGAQRAYLLRAMVNYEENLEVGKGNYARLLK